MFNLPAISDKFDSIHKKDFLVLPIVLLFAFSIDGLYGMGHFLSFGIASIAATHFFISRERIRSPKLNYLLGTLLILIFTWHGVVKFSFWKGLDNFKKNKYSIAISQLERATAMYPKSIGRFHVILGQMYLANGEIEKAKGHALKAQNINPDHDAPVELLKKINVRN